MRFFSAMVSVACFVTPPASAEDTERTTIQDELIENWTIASPRVHKFDSPPTAGPTFFALLGLLRGQKGPDGSQGLIDGIDVSEKVVPKRLLDAVSLVAPAIYFRLKDIADDTGIHIDDYVAGDYFIENAALIVDISAQYMAQESEDWDDTHSYHAIRCADRLADQFIAGAFSFNKDHYTDDERGCAQAE